MTDHLPNYFLLLNKHKIAKQQNNDIVRIFSEKNLQSFKTEITTKLTRNLCTATMTLM